MVNAGDKLPLDEIEFQLLSDEGKLQVSLG
jgi:hypothetical protein